MQQHWLAWWPTVIVLAAAVFTDLRSRRIPNWLVLPFLLVGIVVSPLRTDWSGVRHGLWLPSGWSTLRQGFWPGSGWHGLAESGAGMGLGFLLFGVFFWMGGMGAGDVKLGAALGAWIGPMQVFWMFFFTSLAGGVMALGWIAYRKLLRGALLRASELVFAGARSGESSVPQASVGELLKSYTPYAPAIAVGTVLSFYAR
jgi:prepilin peptidase CpaA